MKRVLFVDHASEILGGAEVNLLELLPFVQREMGWQVAVACPAQGYLGRACADAGINVADYGFEAALNRFRLVGRKFSVVGALRSYQALRRARVRFREVIERFGPSAVVSCANKDHFCVGPLLRPLGIRSFWWVNDVISPQFFSVAVRRVFVRLATRHADRVVVVSDFAREALIREGLAAGLVQRIYNGVPIERYAAGRILGTRKELGLPIDEQLIGFIGRLTPWKGPAFFLEVAEKWVRAGGVGHFVIIGKAFNEEKAYAELLRRRGSMGELAGRVHFISFQDRVAPLLGELDLLLHTSLRPEPFGRVIIEAMAAGVPVIAAGDGAICEILMDSANGWVAVPGDAESFVSRMRMAFEPEARSRVTSAARQTVEERFTVRYAAAAWAALIE